VVFLSLSLHAGYDLCQTVARTDNGRNYPSHDFLHRTCRYSSIYFDGTFSILTITCTVPILDHDLICQIIVCGECDDSCVTISLRRSVRSFCHTRMEYDFCESVNSQTRWKPFHWIQSCTVSCDLRELHQHATDFRASVRVRVSKTDTFWAPLLLPLNGLRGVRSHSTPLHPLRALQKSEKMQGVNSMSGDI
jgi:hypothetical protein